MPTISKPGFLNLTASFRSDSDLVLPYLRIRSGHYHLPNASKILKMKKKLIAWYVSHCNTSSRREDYAFELSKYIKVDIYGKCAKERICKQDLREPCVHDSLEEYKFYFAAENSICKGYFTGKHVYLE